MSQNPKSKNKVKQGTWDSTELKDTTWVNPITQVPLTCYIGQAEPRTTTTNNKKQKKTSGENPPEKKHIMTTPEKKTESVNPQNVSTQNTVDLWEKHFEALKSRLSTSITENVTANVNRNLNNTMLILDMTLKTAMETMTTAVNELIESNKTMIQHKVVMDDLTQENQALSVCINWLETEHIKLWDKFNQFESKELEHCIMMHGIEETDEEDKNYLREQAYYELSFTIDH